MGNHFGDCIHPFAISDQPAGRRCYPSTQKTFSDLIDEGLEQNNEIQSLKDQVESLKNEIPFAGALDDPRLGFAILNLPTDTFDFDQEPMTPETNINCSENSVVQAKLDLRSQRAGLNAIRLKAMLDAKRLELARKIAVVLL